METPEKCPICEESISDSNCVNVRGKGLQTLADASVRRNDGKLQKFKEAEYVVVHVQCRKSYTRETSIKAELKKAGSSGETQQTTPVKDKLRSVELQLKNKCLFCFENIDDEFWEKEKKKHQDKRRIVSTVSSIPLRQTVLNRARERNDKLGKAVEKRIANVFDLVAADAMYHQSCFTEFFRKTQHSGMKRGRPPDEDVTSAMNEIYSVLENSDECQFSIKNLIDQVEGCVPNEKTVRAKLLEKYGHEIIITNAHKRSSTVCFRDTGYKILTNSWYDERKKDEQEERLRIVQAAADIIREDIRSQYHDTSFYPSCDDFLKDVDNVIPNSLDLFLKAIITKRRKGKLEPLNKKCVTIAHAIMTATRPRSFLSPLQIGLAVFLHRKFESKNMLTLLSNLGLCATYNEALMFEASSLFDEGQPVMEGAFCQYVYDNADFNSNTIDGLNTVHIMGGIMCATPSSAVAPHQPMKRLESQPSAKEIARLADIPIKTYEKAPGCGLKQIEVQDLKNMTSEKETELLSLADVLWMCGKALDISGIGGWNGFMQHVTKDMAFELSRVIYLPFVNLPPSSNDAILTVLHSAAKHSEEVNQRTSFVTFDQPLYIKAKDIVSSPSHDPELSNVVVRLGGFHLLMSFMGCIGYIMAGSGLKEVLSVIYAPTSVEKMLTGHAYSRAVRGHSLIQLALAKVIFTHVDLTSDDRCRISEMLHQFKDCPPTFESISEEQTLKNISGKLEEALTKLAERGATAKLWIQYFNLVTLMRKFIQAERMGDWSLHLACIRNMIPYLHASGHFPYAKSCHLYLQDMLNLESKMNEVEYKQFVIEGKFTIRRTERHWAGIWSDMTIEQTLMRSMKSAGGLTHGRGISDSVLSRWILGMPVANNVCDSLEEFFGLSFTTSEQHVDMRESRARRDDTDVQRLCEWFAAHPPFPDLKEVMSVATGLVGDEKINCHDAYQIGTLAMEEMTGKYFHDVKLKRANRVLSLATATSAVKVRDTIVPIDPLLLFQRIAIVKKSDAELMDYLQFELAPFPVSLFNESGMRKTQKSSLYSIFEATSNAEIQAENSAYVIDGGFLLHRVIWHQRQTFRSIFDAYISYVKRHYGSNAVIVFDGYEENATSTKSAERQRRSFKKTTADILFDENMTVSIGQDQFLSNDKNKGRLISLLSKRFEEQAFPVKNAKDDADTLIIETAVEMSSSSQTVVVVGEDVDLLVLLVALASSNIYFLKPGRGRADSKIYSSLDLQSRSQIKDSIMFLHAFSGCDTTSAVFQKGKQKCVKIMEKRDDLKDVIAVFNSAESSHDSVFEAGCKFFLAPKSQYQR